MVTDRKILKGAAFITLLASILFLPTHSDRKNSVTNTAMPEIQKALL